MGKKKRNHPEIDEILSRPWCYYCERDFDDLKILINHQKAKHFKCERCGRRLSTAGGLSVHMTQVHKETLGQIDNALPNRSNLDVEIFGMEGIPEDAKQSHNQRVLTQYAQQEAERRAATGNPPPGQAAGGSAPKKPKIEAASDLKKRLAEHKAKKEAEEAAARSSGEQHGMPDAVDAQAPGVATAPGFAAPGQYPPSYNASQTAPPFGSFPQPYSQPGATFPQAPQAFQSPPGAQFGATAFSPPPQQFPPGQPAYAPPGQYQTGPQPSQFQPGPPRPFGANSPSVPFRDQTSQGMSQPQRPTNLPSAPGLPQRPSFGVPSVNAFQMQQMHQGQMPGHPAMPFNDQPTTNLKADAAQNGAVTVAGAANGESPLPDKSSGLAPPPSASAGQAGLPLPPADNELDLKREDANGEKKSKKEKEKEIRMVYSDNDTSPEEKMARLSRYAFHPEGEQSVLVGGANTAAAAAVSG